MGKGPISENNNVYFKARKKAAIYDERLYSREGAAEMLGISVSTLADYELGNTKVVPVDKVVLMADLYKAPELKNQYCKTECPIGQQMPIATEVKGLEGITIRLLREFDANRLEETKSQLMDIAADGVIDKEEIPHLQKILDRLDGITNVISEMRLAGEKLLKQGGVL